MAELIVVNIVIGDRTYRLKSRSQDEETIRKMAKLINEKITEFKTVFGGKDMQDYIAMVLLWFAVDQAAQGTNIIQENEVKTTLSQMETWLDKALIEL